MNVQFKKTYTREYDLLEMLNLYRITDVNNEGLEELTL